VLCFCASVSSGSQNLMESQQQRYSWFSILWFFYLTGSCDELRFMNWTSLPEQIFLQGNVNSFTLVPSLSSLLSSS
jgi:hypothetical protein